MSQVEVTCSGCCRPRWVSPERARRIKRGVVPDSCRSCKGKPEITLSAALPVADFSDGDVRWWLERYGGTVPTGVPWRSMRQSDLPRELQEVVASLACR